MIGQIVAGKYLIESLLGQGGFASVFAARNTLIDRPVALKILHESVAQEPVVVGRFLREAKLACRSLHPTIVRVEDVGKTDDGTPYLVMELLEGRTLNYEIKEEGIFPLEKAMGVATLLLEGLAAAHAQGIIHRDVKPANVFVVAPGFPDPPVRILDLGMAKDPADKHLLTVCGDVIGTPSYLAPEILLRPKDDVWKPAVDVFAAGMVIFLMLTERLPIEAPATSQGYDAFLNRVLAYKTVKYLRGPAEFNHDVPMPIDVFVRRALSIEPDKRYRNAQEMLTALNEAKARVGIYSVDLGRKPAVQTIELAVDEDPSGSGETIADEATDAVAEAGWATASSTVEDQVEVPPKSGWEAPVSTVEDQVELRGQEKWVAASTTVDDQVGDITKPVTLDQLVYEPEGGFADRSVSGSEPHPPPPPPPPPPEIHTESIALDQIDVVEYRTVEKTTVWTGTGEFDQLPKPDAEGTSPLSLDDLTALEDDSGGNLQSQGGPPPPPPAGSSDRPVPASAVGPAAPARESGQHPGPVVPPSRPPGSEPKPDWLNQPSSEPSTLKPASLSIQASSSEGSWTGPRKAIFVGMVLLLLVVVVGATVMVWLSLNAGAERPSRAAAHGAVEATTEDVATAPTDILEGSISSGAPASPAAATPDLVDASVLPEIEEGAVPTSPDPTLEPDPVVEPELVKIRLTGLPEKAAVTVDGEEVTDPWFQGAPGTKRLVVVRAKGYQRYRQWVPLEESDDLDFSKLLRRVGPGDSARPAVGAKTSGGFISVAAEPRSRVYLGSRLLGNTPIRKRAVPVGRHSLTLMNTKHPTKSLSVEIRPGKTTNIRHNF